MHIFKYIAFYFSILSIGLSFQTVKAQSETPKGKLVIIGGGSRPSSMIDRIIKESGIDKAGYGVILPMSSSEPDSAVYYAKIQFKEKGLDNVVGLDFKKDEVLKASKIDSLKSAALIYISGGDQNRFMDVAGGNDIEKAIHEAYKSGSIVAGTSAGAAVMSEKMITGNELKYPDYSSTFRNIEANNIEIKKGLGLISNVIIDQHFVKRSRYNRLISAVIEHPIDLGIGIDESTAIIVDGRNIEVIGESQVVVISNTEKRKTEFKDKVAAKNIKLDLYLPNQTFTLK